MKIHTLGTHRAAGGGGRENLKRCLVSFLTHYSLKEIKYIKILTVYWKIIQLKLFGARAIKQQRKPLTQKHFACDQTKCQSGCCFFNL